MICYELTGTEMGQKWGDRNGVSHIFSSSILHQKSPMNLQPGAPFFALAENALRSLGEEGRMRTLQTYSFLSLRMARQRFKPHNYAVFFVYP